MLTLQAINQKEQNLIASFKSHLFRSWLLSGVINPIKFMRSFFLYGLYSAPARSWKDVLYNGFRIHDGAHDTAEFEKLEAQRKLIVETTLRATYLPSYVYEDVIGCKTLSALWPMRRLRQELGSLSSHGSKCYYSHEALFVPSISLDKHYLLSVCLFKNDKTFEYRWVRLVPTAIFSWPEANLDYLQPSTTFTQSGVCKVYDPEDIECKQVITTCTFNMQVTIDNLKQYIEDDSEYFQVNTGFTFNESNNLN